MVPDLLDALSRGKAPPPRLRYGVGGTASRDDFLRVGRAAADSIEKCFLAARDSRENYCRWLDFGCGAGRVGRHLAAFDPVRELWGVDTDNEAIAWASRHLPGRYLAIAPDPPTPLDAGSFDVVCTVSVFTHFDEARQLRWLSELHRLLQPGGLLLASTHGPELTWSRPDLTSKQRGDLERRGFLFAPGRGSRFSDDSAFHAKSYLLEEWGRLFGLLSFEDRGLAGYQDLSVWRKW
jgi:SAM-dependent methyltransferase